MVIQKFTRINERIKAPELRVIGPESEQLGVVVLKRALELAKEHDLDLSRNCTDGKATSMPNYGLQ